MSTKIPRNVVAFQIPEGPRVRSPFGPQFQPLAFTADEAELSDRVERLMAVRTRDPKIARAVLRIMDSVLRSYGA